MGVRIFILRNVAGGEGWDSGKPRDWLLNYKLITRLFKTVGHSTISSTLPPCQCEHYLLSSFKFHTRMV